MKVLVIGSKGSMGKRICAILKYLGVDYVGLDINQSVSIEDVIEFTHLYIATPTDTHVTAIKNWYSDIKNILCEKPVSKDPEEIKDLLKLDCNINMVCNWKYVFPVDYIGKYNIEYSNYNTGKDGTGWDCIQLIYLANKLTIDTSLPYFRCTYNPSDTKEGITREVDLNDVEMSYINMIEHWLGLNNRRNDLWDLKHALKATQKVILWNKENRDYE